MAHHASAVAPKRKTPDEETAGGDGLCINGCGFFGAAATANMCSKCYRVHADAAGVTTSVVFAAASTAPPLKKAKMTVPAASSAVDPSSLPVTTAVEEQPADAKKPQPTAANRCAACRKKVGLTGFRCRCEGTFCGLHRYAEKHDCGYDYKTAGREQIIKQNPLVVADKITRI